MQKKRARGPLGLLVVGVMLVGEGCQAGNGRDNAAPTSTRAAMPGPPPPISPPGPVTVRAAGITEPTGPPHEVPAAIPADCSADVTDRLSGWLSSVPDGSVVALSPKGCYRLDGTLLLSDRRNLLIDGKGATLKAMTDGDQKRAHVKLVGGSNLTVRHLRVVGANTRGGEGGYVPERAFQHGFSFLGVNGGYLDGASGSDVYGDFVYIGPGAAVPDTPKAPSRNITVANSHFVRSGRQGIAITSADDVLVTGNAIGDVPRSMFDLETNKPDQSARRIEISRNHTGRATNFWLANKGAGNNIGDITVRDNRMEAPTGGLVFVYGKPGGLRGPYIFQGNSLVITDAVHDEGSRGAFFLVNARDISILDNHLRVVSGGAAPAIELRAADQVTVSGNRFEGTGPDVEADAASTGVKNP